MRIPSRLPNRSERGSALVISLLILVTIAAIATGLMTSITSERRMVSYNMMSARALNYAEAGVSEAVERIRRNDIEDNGDPRMVAQIFLTSPGAVPEVGADTVALGTGQSVGNWIKYSTATKGPDVLTVEYKTDPAKTTIYKYDSGANPAIQTASGSPIFVITSAGRVGDITRRVRAEVSNTIISPNLKGAVVGKENVMLDGDVTVNGIDYIANFPTGTGSDGYRHPEWESGTDSLAGVWSGDKIDTKKTPTIFGNPPEADKMGKGNFYAGPWEALNMTQTAFWDWIGDPDPTKEPAASPRGITYHAKSNGDKQDVKYKGNFYGDGFLYVTGKLEIDGDFTFRGMIYCEDEIKIHGVAWIAGTVIGKKFHLHAKNSKKAPAKKSFKLKSKKKQEKLQDNNITILLSKETIEKTINQSGGGYLTLSWREIP